MEVVEALLVVVEGVVLGVAAALEVVAAVAEEVSRRTGGTVRVKDSHGPASLSSRTEETTMLAAAAAASNTCNLL